jgi:hypothetical protein
MAEGLVAGGLLVGQVGEHRPPRHGHAGDEEACDPHAVVAVPHGDAEAVEQRVVQSPDGADRHDERAERSEPLECAHVVDDEVDELQGA